MKLLERFYKRLQSGKTSKDIALDPITFENTVIIPLHHLEMETITEDTKLIFGKSEPIGVIKIKDHDIELLSINNSLTLETLKNNIPELSDMIDSANRPEEVL